MKYFWKYGKISSNSSKIHKNVKYMNTFGNMVRFHVIQVRFIKM